MTNVVSTQRRGIACSLRRYGTLRGRYELSNVNLDHHWVGRDMVGIDAGAAVLALDNYLMADRTRTLFQGLPCVRRGMARLGFTPAAVEGAASPGRTLGTAG